MNGRFLLIGAAVVAALQIGFLGWMIAGRAAALRDGQEVLLKVEPIDPRDLLRGDFVRLGYEAGALPAAIFVPKLAAPGDYGQRDVWVLLRKDGDGVYQPAAAALDRSALPPAAAGEAVLRGTIPSLPDAEGTVTADYGIGRFYLPEGEGKQIEIDMRERPFYVVAAVGADGSAQIKRFLDGTTVLYEEPFY